MTDRADEIATFLALTGWHGAKETPVQADFSTRRFMRLERENTTLRRVILMDAEAGQNTVQFVALARLLRSLDISAPEIYAEDAPQGLVLMEDFGDRNIGRLIDAGADAKPLYRRAVDVLVQLHKSVKLGGSLLESTVMTPRSSPLARLRQEATARSGLVAPKLEERRRKGEDRRGVGSTSTEFSFCGENPTPDPARKGWGTRTADISLQTIQGLDLPIFSGALFAAQAELFLDAYFVFAKGREATIGEAEGFRAAWKEALKGIEALPQTLMLRDFMPDNLMLLDHPGWRGIGVLDFQDGGIGPLPYDLASLCEVVRRDGGDAMLDDLIDYYHAQASLALSKAELRSACRVLAAQRHMRILGIIARLAMNGRKEKIEYVPRIWNYLEQLLKDDALKIVREWVKENKLI